MVLVHAFSENKWTVGGISCPCFHVPYSIFCLLYSVFLIPSSVFLILYSLYSILYSVFLISYCRIVTMEQPSIFTHCLQSASGWSGSFVFNCFYNSIQDVHGGANKTSSVALNELLLENSPSGSLLAEAKWKVWKGKGARRLATWSSTHLYCNTQFSEKHHATLAIQTEGSNQMCYSTM